MNEPNDKTKADKPTQPRVAPTIQPVHKDDKQQQARHAKNDSHLNTGGTNQAPNPKLPAADSVPMSKQQQQSMPSIDEVKGKWKQQVGSAKVIWAKLTDDEILLTEGHEEKLAGLVEERYAVTRTEAKKQVRGFLDKLKP